MRLQAYEELECAFAEFNGVEPCHMVSCSSGTAALHLAFEAMMRGLNPSRIFMSNFNMIACPRAVTMSGHQPVFLDCTEDLLLDPAKVPFVCGAVIATHIYGRICNVDQIHDGREAIPIVEDMAELHGVLPHQSTQAACWSFYKNKIISGEEGGMVYFKYPGVANIARQLRSLGMNEDNDCHYIPRGHNYRLSNCHADLIMDSLKMFHTNVAHRREQIDLYDRYLPKEWHQPERLSPWVYDLRIPGLDGTGLYKIIPPLRNFGIQARYSFKPMNSQEEYRGSETNHEGFPNSYKAAREVFYLPLGTTTSAQVAKRVCDEVIRIVESALFELR